MNLRRRYKAKARRREKRIHEDLLNACHARGNRKELTAKLMVALAAAERLMQFGSGAGQPKGFLRANGKGQLMTPDGTIIGSVESIEYLPSTIDPNIGLLSSCLPPNPICACHECQGIRCMVWHPGHSHRDSLPPGSPSVVH